MNWFYILIRTFPFWAIPIGVGLMTSGFRSKGRKLVGVSGIALVGAAIAFLVLRGHFKAVPWVHDVIYDPTPAPKEPDLR